MGEHFNWDKLKDKEIAFKIFNLIKQGYTNRIACEIIGEEYDIDFNRMYGRLSVFTKQFNEEYKDALENKIGIKKGFEWNEESDRKLKNIIEVEISKGEKLTNACAAASKQIRCFKFEAYLRWNNNFIKKKPKVEIIKSGIEEKLDAVITLHKDKLIGDEQFIELIYKIREE